MVLFWILVLFVLLAIGICVSGGLLMLCFGFVASGVVAWLGIARWRCLGSSCLLLTV